MPKTGGLKVSALDVRDFFKTADLELAELVLSLAGDTVADKRATKKAAVDRMAKARAGRGKGKKASSNTNASIPAPAHTAQATAVAADA